MILKGHEKTLAALGSELPPASLLLGPESTGKWLAAERIAKQHAPWHARREIRCLRVGDARDLRKFLEIVPADWPVKVVVACLDGSGEAAQHALLKILEEPPEYARFLLTASRPPLATITSRCVIFRSGQLTDQQVADVLVDSGMDKAVAVKIAPAGRGQVSNAIAAQQGYGRGRASVLAVMRAVVSRDRELLERAAKDWGDVEEWLLGELLAAAATGRPSALFTVQERAGTGKSLARRAILYRDMYRGARPSIAVRVMADQLMSRGGP